MGRQFAVRTAGRHGAMYRGYQTKIAQAQHDLAHINAVIRLVEDGEQERDRYIVSHGFFKND
jgi:hypothetical protein